MLAMVVFGGVETAFAGTLYTFTTIDVPGAGFPFGTVAYGINDSGQIVGYFKYTSRLVFHGFLATPVAAVPEPDI
jgi:probable HAF family extracellular repeat protein